MIEVKSKFKRRREDDGEHEEPKCIETEESARWVSSMASGVSPLPEICESYGDSIVSFDADFVDAVIDFYRNDYTGKDELLERVTRANASDLAVRGLFAFFLEKEPESLDVIQAVLERCDDSGVKWFVDNCGGLYLIAKYSRTNELKMTMSKMLRDSFKVELDYTATVFPPFTAAQVFGDEDVGEIVEFCPVEIFRNLVEGADVEVMRNLLDGLKVAFKWTPAVVAFSPWLLQSVGDLLGGELAPLCIEVLALGLRSIPSCLLKSWNAPELVVRFLQSGVEKLQLVGMKLVQVLFEELTQFFELESLLEHLLSEDVKQPLLAMVRDGSFEVKEQALNTLKEMIERCPLPNFRAFVEPDIIGMVFELFESDCANSDGILAAEKSIALDVIEIVRKLSAKYPFLAGDETIRANMHHICCSLRDMLGSLDPEIARAAESLLLQMAPFWEPNE